MINMSNMSSTDAIIHAAQDLIHALQNLAPANPIVTLGNSFKETLRHPADIFSKATYPAVPLSVPVKGAYQEKLQQVNQE